MQIETDALGHPLELHNAAANGVFRNNRRALARYDRRQPGSLNAICHRHLFRADTTWVRAYTPSPRKTISLPLDMD
jgi:hypothetical protein